MKKFFLVFAAFFSGIVTSQGQSINQTGFVKFFPVSSDEMKFTQSGFVPDGKIYWVETDESFGEVFLSFSNIAHPGNPTSASLIFNIPQVTDAQSSTGVNVYFENKVIGNAGQASSGSNLKINLDISLLKGKNQFTLVLKGGGPDGLAIFSKASGYGAYLEFIY
ncbi:MAG: hypothetical protein U0W24_26630 [Bacteroidales bacterium]